MGNSIRYIGMSPRDDALKVEGIDNLYCAGEKAGSLVGHTEAICTGTLAGFNAVKKVNGENQVILPEESILGYTIKYVREQMKTPEGLGLKFTFSGSVLFERMKQQDMYSIDSELIMDRVEKAGLTQIFA